MFYILDSGYSNDQRPRKASIPIVHQEQAFDEPMDCDRCDCTDCECGCGDDCDCDCDGGCQCRFE